MPSRLAQHSCARWLAEQAATEKATIQDAARALAARLMILDASSPSEVESAFAASVQALGGKVDACFANAGVSLGRPLQGRSFLFTAGYRF